MDKRTQAVRRLRAAAALILVALYAAGLVLMLASHVKLALILWVVSTLGGIGLLYWLKTLKEREEAAKGESDAPTEAK